LLLSLDVAITAAPDNKILQFAKGMALGNLNKYEEAKTAYKAAIAIDADYFDAYNNLAGLYLDQTVSLIEKMNSLGLSAADQKKYTAIKKKRNYLYSSAKPYLEEAVRIDDTAIEVLSALKEVCYQTDDIDCWKRINNQAKLITGLESDLNNKPFPPYGEPSSTSVFKSDGYESLSYTYNCYSGKYIVVTYIMSDSKWEQKSVYETDDGICD